MKLCVIGAMEEEISTLKKELQDISEQTIAGQNFIEGFFEGKEVILIKSGAGKVNAAVSATLANQIFRPEYIINIGSAGGFSPACNIGDLIVSSEVRYHDVDLTVFGYEYGQASQMPASFKPDDKLLAITESCSMSLPEINIKKGLITSGDSFVSNDHQVSLIKDRFTEICAAEMEGCAIAHVCYLFNTPFIIFRFISDIVNAAGNKDTHEKNLEMVATKTADLLKCIFKKL